MFGQIWKIDYLCGVNHYSHQKRILSNPDLSV